MKMVWLIFLLVVLAVGTFLWHGKETVPERVIFDNMRKQGENFPSPIPAKSLPSSEGNSYFQEGKKDEIPAEMVGKDGSAVYDRYCVSCHGVNGDGKGAMAAYPEFPVIGPFWSDKYKDYPEGKIFRSIADGQGNMPSFSSRMTAKEIGMAVNRVIELKQCGGIMNGKKEK